VTLFRRLLGLLLEALLQGVVVGLRLRRERREVREKRGEREERRERREKRERREGERNLLLLDPL
jgi:hypothetical protein